MLSQGTLAELQRRIANVSNQNGFVNSWVSGYTQSPDTESATGERTIALTTDGYSHVNTAGFHISITFVIEIQSRTSCRIKITAWSGHFSSPANPLAEVFHVDLFDETGGGLSSDYSINDLDTWTPTINTGRYLVRLSQTS